MQLIDFVRRHVRPAVVGGIAGLVLVASVASAATTVLDKTPPKKPVKSGVKGAQFTKGAKGDRGDDGKRGPRGPQGPAGPAGPTGPQGPIGPQGPAGPQGQTGATGAPGAPGATGAAGAKGDKGDTGATGAQGAQGATGAPGADGAKGDKGDKGDTGKDADEEYGVAVVNIQRGAGAAGPWAVYSTELGSPVGDTTGGTFRFTCTPEQAPCKVSLKAKVLSDSSVAPGRIHPRVLIHRGGGRDSSVEPMYFCEYGDGPVSTIARLPKADATPTGAPVTVNIGGSADCGVTGATAGDVTEIQVREGYYDVWSTFTFFQS